MDVMKCYQCGLNNPSTERFCERCGSELKVGGGVSDGSDVAAEGPVVKAVEGKGTPASADSAPLPQHPSEIVIKVNKQQILGLVGSVILFVGVFTPIVSLPFVGSVNYFQNGRGDGVIIAALAVVSLILTLGKRYRGLLLTGVISLGLLAYTFISFQSRMSEARSQMERQLGNNPFKGLGDVMLQSVQLQWGWAVLLVGAVLLIFAGAVRRQAAGGGSTASSILGVSDASSSSVTNQSASLSLVEPETDAFRRDAWSNKKVGIAVGVTILAAGLVLYYTHTNDSGGVPFGGQTARRDNAKTEVSPKLKAMRDALTATVSDKGFSKADIYNGRYQDYNTFKVTYTNRTQKDIRGFKGTVAFYDMFGDRIMNISLKEDDVLKAGQTKTVERTLDYNQFMDEHQRLRNANLQNIRVEWSPDTILFVDGTSLGLDGDS